MVISNNRLSGDSLDRDPYPLRRVVSSAFHCRADRCGPLAYCVHVPNRRTRSSTFALSVRGRVDLRHRCGDVRAVGRVHAVLALDKTEREGLPR